MATEYQIVGIYGIIIGRYPNKQDRDIALLRHCNYGFAREETI